MANSTADRVRSIARLTLNLHADRRDLVVSRSRNRRRTTRRWPIPTVVGDRGLERCRSAVPAGPHRHRAGMRSAATGYYRRWSATHPRKESESPISCSRMAVASCLAWPWTPQIVESKSITKSVLPELAPAAHELIDNREATASSWRTCPNSKVRTDVQTVDWAITLNGQHRPGCSGAPHVNVIDVAGAGDHGCDQGADLTAGANDQLGVGDQVVVIKGRIEPVDGERLLGTLNRAPTFGTGLPVVGVAVRPAIRRTTSQPATALST